MLIDNVKLPKIINDVAKFDARKKKYVPYRSALDNSSDDKKLEVLLLAELQTKWDKLQKQSTGNNKLSNFLKSTAKYYRQGLTLSDREFTSTSAYMRCFDKQWLHWNQALCQFQNDLYEQLMPLHKSSFSEFQTYVNDKSAKEYKSKKALKIAWQTITSFIDYQNKHFMLAEHYYPKIIAPQPTKSNTLIINADWVTRGKELTKIIRAAREHWYETTNYSHDEILGWLLFSGIVYGGINEKQMLQGWLAALLTKEHQAFIHQRVFVSPRFAQKRYGNERVEDSDKLYNTKQIILDLVSQCWLIHYHQQSDQKDIKHALAQLSQEKIEHYLTNTLAIVTEPLKLNTLTLSRLLYYASYHWEMLDNVDIDQASVAVLRGNQNTAGLPSHGFNQLLNQNYKNKVQDYDLKNILKLSISAMAPSETAPISSSYKKAEVRKADLIIQLNKDFKQTEELKKKKLNYTPPTLIERIKKRCHQYTDLSEAILLEWVLSLLSKNKPPSNTSILQYIKTIGYEWLYFTMAQPLDIWSEEDFEALYEDILEYKAVARGNTDIVYSANLFQRMHNFAKDKYGLPAVTLQQSKNGRRVRAELVSPQAYRAIIKQILASIDI
ncbi:MAG TPA: hypothetical protein VLN09_11425, partial [Psychrobacter sp.]|uniref:hypothetical protein n=1 Tax=Psychrobacter sp. TaxID=56811 RepID=UPI002BF32CB4